MEESAALARRLGLQLHTHLAETVEEEAYCPSSTAAGRSSTSSGSAGWTATCGARTASTSPTSEVPGSRAAGAGVAHCPTSNLRLGAGVAPVREMLDAGVRVGLGVDGSASNERGDLFLEVKQALLVARGRGGAEAMTAREAPGSATRGGASVLRRDDIGSLEPGKRADVAVWRTDGLELGGADDLSAAIVLSGPHRVDRLFVGGEEVVRDGRLVHADEEEIAQEHRRPGGEVAGMSGASPRTSSTPGSGRPAAGVRVELSRGRPSPAGDDGRGRPHPRARTGRAGPLPSSSIRRRRSSAASS